MLSPKFHMRYTKPWSQGEGEGAEPYVSTPSRTYNLRSHRVKDTLEEYVEKLGD